MALIGRSALGAVHITETALAILVGAAVEHCAGIVGMASGRLMDGINELLRRENYGRGAKVTSQNGQLHVQIRVIVEYGVNIHAMAQSAVEMIRYYITQQTGMRVASVEVLVAGVRV